MSQTAGTDEIRISIATMEDRERVLSAVSSAFRNDPFLRRLFPDDADYAAHAPTFFGALFDKRVGAGTIWMADAASSIAMWDGPGSMPLPVLDLPKPALQLLSEYDDAVESAFPDDRHWYLGVLATDPLQAGRGLGRAVMRAGLARAAAEGLPAFLETTNEQNVPLYERAGWMVAAELEAPMRIWVMRQDPPA